MPTQLIESFYKIVLNKFGLGSLILYEIQKQLRIMKDEQLKNPIELKDKLIKK